VQRGDTGVRIGIDERSTVHRGARRLGLLLLAVHLGLVLWTAFLPVSAAWMADTNLTPFATVRTELAAGTEHAYLELLRSLLLLAPLGLLLPLAGGRVVSSPLWSFLRTVLAGVLIATGVEVLQSTLTSHLLNVDDILLAAVGIAAAHLAVVPAFRAALRRRDRDQDGQHRGPGLPLAAPGFGAAHSAR
jgi:glycopeptide antibiotics resistance protein